MEKQPTEQAEQSSPYGSFGSNPETKSQSPMGSFGSSSVRLSMPMEGSSDAIR